MWTGFYAGLNAGYGFGTNSNVQSVAIGQDKPVGFYSEPVPEVLLDTIDGGAHYLSLPTGAGLAQSGSFANTQNGFIGGGQVGYNYQWGSSFVIGIEADMQGTGIRGASHGIGSGWGSVSYPYLYAVPAGVDSVNLAAPPPSPTIGWDANSVGITSVHSGVDWMGTVRGRVGYLFTPTMLLYATGGLTYGGVYANVNSVAMTTITPNYSGPSFETLSLGGMGLGSSASNYTFVGGGNKSQTLVGWNVGGGLEWMFMPNWSLKAEAIYWNMGNMTVPTATFAAAPDSYHVPLVTVGAVRVNYQGVIARAGVNYHFNWFAPAPVVASY
ncbi:outer-membrane immunogenic protein [Methylocystis echinoides]|uniref:Outer-membrane immunogenic protein n=2 Tax=Methylocystis echinoides TaxID=29468 RepID=A0A9W6GTZ2_9HYPH|nr:outer-membrane immunogenic protein [Methylocystis echinoides]